MAEASQSLQTISEHLDCIICEDRLKNPKDLDCSHTFCRKCLIDYAQSINATTKISCPLCRQVTKLPRGGIASLKTSYLLRNLVDAVPVEDARLPKHRAPIEEGTKICSIHKGVARDIYCETCNVLVCHKCIGTGHCSTGHRHYKLDQRASYARNFMKTLCVETEDKLADLNSLQEQIGQIEHELYENRRETIDKIDDRVKKVISKVTHRHDTLINEINGKYLADVEALQRQKDRIETLECRLATLHDETKEVAKNPDDEIVVLNESNLALRNESHRRKLELSSESTFFDFQQIDVKIGSLNSKSQRKLITAKKISSTFHWVRCKAIAGSRFDHDVAVSSSGSILAVPNGKAIEIYNIDSGQLIRSIRGTPEERLESPTGVIFLPNGTMALLDTGSQFIRLFSQDGEFRGKFSTLDASEDESTPVKLTCIAIDMKSGVIVVGDGKRNVLTFHQTDGTYLQTLYLETKPISVDIRVASGLVAYVDGIAVHILSLTGKKLLVLDKYGDTYWPLAPTGVCFDHNSKSLFICRSMPLGEKSIHQYKIPSGKYIGCVYKDLSRPAGLTFFQNKRLAVADGSSVKILQNMTETEL